MSGFRERIEKKVPWLVDMVDLMAGRATPLFVDFKPAPIPRYGHGKPPHPGLYEIIDHGRKEYEALLTQFLGFTDQLTRIPVSKADPVTPVWRNGFLPALDAVALYGLLAMHNPRRYIEIGSGHSTRFARRCISDNGLRTSITSVDPSPRAEVDALCDRVIRQPVEEIDTALFSELEHGDFLFVDNSHRALPNSDVVVTFLEILPALKAGVFVHFHDIVLPYDYGPVFARRAYSEQYLLACYLLAGGGLFRTVLPNMFISKDADLSQVLAPLWNRPEMLGTATHGQSYWIQVLQTPPA